MTTIHISTRARYTADWGPHSVTSSGDHTTTYTASVTIRRLTWRERVRNVLRRRTS